MRCKWLSGPTGYFKAIYLSAKLARTKDPPASSSKKPANVMPPSRIELGLPADVLVEITGARHLIILEYIIEQIVRRAAAKSALRGP